MSDIRYIFLDLETTGLDAHIDQITEAAWVFEDGSERHFFVKHDRLPSDWVLRRTDYLTRVMPAQKTNELDVMQQLRLDCMGSRTYLVGACPAFDDRFLRQLFEVRWRSQIPYNYHVIDVEAMAMGALGHEEPCALKDLRAALGIAGENPAEHTALSDAREVKLIFDALKKKKT